MMTLLDDMERMSQLAHYYEFNDIGRRLSVYMWVVVKLFSGLEDKFPSSK